MRVQKGEEMKVEIIGIGKRNSGISKKTGNPFNMTAIYGISAAHDLAEGEKAVELTFNHLSDMIFPDLHVGDVVHASHDQRGYLEELEVIEKASAGKGNVKLNSGNS